MRKLNKTWIQSHLGVIFAESKGCCFFIFCGVYLMVLQSAVVRFLFPPPLPFSMWDLLDDLGQASPVAGSDLDLVLNKHGAERPHPCKPIPGCFPSAWERILGQNLVKFLAVKKQPTKLLVKKWLIEIHPVPGCLYCCLVSCRSFGCCSFRIRS